MKEYAKSFYLSKAWIQTRKAYMESKNHLCERCLKRGILNKAKIVHHKIHLTPENIDDYNIALSFTNLEALCQDCHNAEHHGKEQPASYRINADGSISPLS